MAELETVLGSIAPDEAPQAGDIVKHPYERASAQESAFGFPGAGAVQLIGPWVLEWVVGIASDLLTSIKEEALKKAAEAAVAWLASRFPKAKPILAPSREDVIARVERQLTALRWTPAGARAAANGIWAAGKNASDRLILLASGDEVQALRSTRPR